jgi:two-component system sensor histidine kinase HydH
MWKRVALPTLVVALLWLIAGSATTLYLLWLDASYQRVFRENVAPRELIADLMEDLWRVEADESMRTSLPSDMEYRTSKPDQLQQDLERIADWMTSHEEQSAFTELRRLIQDYENSFEGQDNLEPAVRATRRRAIVEEIDQQAETIRRINQQMIDDSAASRQRTTTIVLWMRVATLIIGPAGGAACGWWMAKRLHQKVRRIRVTLGTDTGLAPPTPELTDLGTIALAPDDDLDDIRGQVEGLVEKLHATTRELASAREEVVRGERLAAIGELAAGVAHEMRNPLTSVKLLLQHAARGDARSLAGPKLRLILEEVERMETTIQGLLDFSRPPSPRQIRHDLLDPLQQAVHLIEGRARNQGVRVEWTLGVGPLWCDGDPGQLQQVFVNLLINGIEAMPEGGLLAVQVRRTPDCVCEIEFADEGAGVPAESLARLFEPFVSLKERGTGLGLAISRRIMESHGGTITVANRETGGARFTLFLPLAKDLDPKDSAEAPETPRVTGTLQEVMK